MISPTKLRVLVALARYGTLRAAADLLSYSPSSVSWQLAELEREVRIPLAVRVGRRLELTEAGQWLASEAGRILGDLDALENQLAHYREKPAGSVRLAVFPSAGHDLIVPMLATMQSTHPQIDVSVLEREPEDALADLAQNETDLAVVCEYSLVPLAIDPSLTSERILTEEVFLALTSEDPAAKTNQPIHIGSLRDHIWLAGERGGDDADLAERVCATGGYLPVVKHTISDYRMMLSMIKFGFGIGFVPQMALDQAPDGVAIRRCQGVPLSRNVMLVHRSGSQARPILSAIRETLRNAVDAAAVDVADTDN